MKYSIFAAIGRLAFRSQHSSGMTSLTRPFLLLLMFSLSFMAGQVPAQCGSLVGPSTTWNDGNGSWSVGGNWTSGAPNASTNACILDGTSTVTLDTTGNANALQLASGNVLSFAGGSLTLVSGTSLNLGSILVGVGTLNVLSAFNNASGAMIGGTAPINNYGTLNNASGAFIGTSGLFDNFGTINNASGAVFGAYLVNNYGTINNSGLFGAYHLAGPIINYGTLTNASGGDMQFLGYRGDTNFGAINNSSDATLSVPGFLTNYGAVTNASGGNLIILGAFGVLTNYGTLTNNGVFNNMSGANLTNSGTINNTGIFANSSAVMISSTGLFTTSTNYTQTAGSTVVNGMLSATSGAIVNIQGGMLGGTGTINGDVLMAGTMMPGAPGTPGSLVIFGNYEQKDTGILEELMGPLSHSFLDVSGNVSLDPGAFLDITLLNGFDPLNRTFSIMDFAFLNGQFVNGSSFWDDNYLWNITYRQHEIDVTAVQAPEPSSLLLLFIGMAVLTLYAHRKMGKTQHLA